MHSTRTTRTKRGNHERWDSVRRLIFIGPMADDSVQRALASLDTTTGVIAVDGGVDVVLRLKIETDLAIGDWDSVSSTKRVARLRQRGTEIVSLARAKDESDLRAAIRAARKRVPRSHEIDRVEAYGFSRGRPDQSLAAHFDWIEAARLFSEASVVHRDSESESHYLSGTIENYRFRDLTPGQTLSLFSLAPISRGVTLKGVDFPLVNADLRPSSLGLSNRVNRRSVVFNLRSGCIIAILLSDPLPNSRRNVRRSSMKS